MTTSVPYLHPSSHAGHLPARRDHGGGRHRPSPSWCWCSSATRLFGLFLVVGVALGTLNMWLAVRSVARFATSRPSKARFSGSVLGRLAVITVVALVMAWLVRPAGMAIFAGLALFQVLAIVSSMLPLIKEIRQK